MDVKGIALAAKKASAGLRSLSAEEKTAALLKCAEALREAKDEIQKLNSEDIAEGRQGGLSAAMLDRLELNDSRYDAMVQGVIDVAGQDDPVGEVTYSDTRPNGLQLEKVRCPIGLIGIIFESRPNVTADAAALCFKAGNAVVLRGGKEAKRSNVAIAAAFKQGLRDSGLSDDLIHLLPAESRDEVTALVQLDGIVDLVIPRGGESLIRAVTEQARVPVIKHYKGLCHIFIDADCDATKAIAICQNAKCQRPGVCNAVETILVHEEVAADIIPKLVEALSEVEIRGCLRSVELSEAIVPASKEDWDEEYLDLIVSVKIVYDFEEALSHIETHSSHHSDAIVTENKETAERFLREVDSASVLHNASTRFVDGGEFGFGAEIGISTDKLHARGPMGVADLTIYKYAVRGEGQVR